MKQVWDHAKWVQLVARAYRIGATQSVRVHRLIGRGTIEEVMAEMNQSASEETGPQFTPKERVYKLLKEVELIRTGDESRRASAEAEAEAARDVAAGLSAADATEATTAGATTAAAAITTATVADNVAPANRLADDGMGVLESTSFAGGAAARNDLGSADMKTTTDDDDNGGPAQIPDGSVGDAFNSAATIHDIDKPSPISPPLQRRVRFAVPEAGNGMDVDDGGSNEGDAGAYPARVSIPADSTDAASREDQFTRTYAHALATTHPTTAPASVQMPASVEVAVAVVDVHVENAGATLAETAVTATANPSANPEHNPDSNPKLDADPANWCPADVQAWLRHDRRLSTEVADLFEGVDGNELISFQKVEFVEALTSAGTLSQIRAEGLYTYLRRLVLPTN